MDRSYHFSAPGRAEIGGNHTDHQHGCVLAAAIQLETKAEVRLNGTNCIRIASEGYPHTEICLSDLAVHPEEKNTTAALRRRLPRAAAVFPALTRLSRPRCCPAPGFPARQRLRFCSAEL